jgi:Mg-chelatase subunit ChlD
MKTISLVKDPTGAAAVDITTLGSAHVDLAKRAQKAGISLSKRGLGGIRAQAVLILDHSGSMRSDYKNGTVQMLVERALGFALQVDVDGEIPVIPFDTKVKKTVPVNLRNYQGIVDSEIFKRRDMGTTDLAAALDVLKEMATKTDAPIFAIIVTDGSPNNRRATTKIVCELADYPVFLKFLAILPVDYLQELDDLDSSKRRVDNADAKFVTNPAAMSDLEFAEAMVDEWDTWIKAATEAGIIAT